MTRYFEAFVGESPLLEFRLQLDGLPMDVSTGYTMKLSGEDASDGTELDDVDCADAEEGADWANGIITVRAAASDRAKRLLVALVVTRTAVADSDPEDDVDDSVPEAVTVVDTGVLVVRHRPGLADATD